MQLLQKHGFLQYDAEDAITKLEAKKYFCESRYVYARIKGLMRKNCSIYFIQQKLQQEDVQVSRQAIEDVFSEFGVTQASQMQELVVKKLQKYANLEAMSIPEITKIKSKLLLFLASKGHDCSVAFDLVSSILSSTHNR